MIIVHRAPNQTLETNADFASLRQHRSAFRWAKSSMRRRVWLSVAFLFLTGLALWRVASQASFGKPDLSVVFVGFTNNPQMTMEPVRVNVTEGANGLCALFSIANTRTDELLIQFKTASVEWNDGRGWSRFVPTARWAGPEGSLWQPGYSCLYAVAWPPGLSTNSAWRLLMSFALEPSGLRLSVNKKLKRELFGPYHWRTTVSSEVKQ